VTALRIGLDFDNTLAGYDDVFADAAREAGLVGPDFRGSKYDVRKLCRARPGGETDWMRLQGRVYGALMPKARLVEGVEVFLDRCRRAKVRLFIISHKTEYGHFDDARVNLRDAARAWMDANGFFDPNRFGLSPSDVFFEDDRASKIARVASLSCTHFVDDLEEVFRDPGFPEATRRILFTAGRSASPGPYFALPNWKTIGDIVLGR
jgi:hypothetical protein